MEKKTKKVVCPRCSGNGYIKIPHESVENLGRSVIAQCSMCESEGEINEIEDKIFSSIPEFNDDPTRMH